jgi:hypothetical protein
MNIYLPVADTKMARLARNETWEGSSQPNFTYCRFFSVTEPYNWLHKNGHLESKACVS